MAAIPVPGVNTPTYQSWASQVANRLNYPPMARMTSNAGLDVVPNVTTKMTFDTTNYDRLGMFDAAQQGFRIPSGEGGVYHINFTMLFGGATTMTLRWGRLFKNGSSFTGHDISVPSVSSGETTSLNWSDDIPAVQGDLFTCHVYHKNASNMNVKAAFSIRKVAETQ